MFQEIKHNIKEKTMKTREQYNISRPKTITNKLKDITTQQSNNGSTKNKFTTPHIPTKLDNDEKYGTIRQTELSDKPKKAHFAYLKTLQRFPTPHGTTKLWK
jgi:hypothetical protein